MLAKKQASRHQRAHFSKFSLRTLILVVGLGPLLIVWWWQRPFEIEATFNQFPVNHIHQRWLIEQLSFSKQYGPASRSDPLREVRTVRRWRMGDPVQDGVTTGFGKNNQKMTVEHWRNGQLNGEVKAWFPGGDLAIQGEYLDHFPHGRWTKWDPQGRKVAEEQYDRGQHAGKWTEYIYSQGQLHTTKETWWKDDVRQKDLLKSFGLPLHVERLTEYDEQGQVRRRKSWGGKGEQRHSTVTHYVAGKQHGESLGWWPNGQKQYEKDWRNGIPVGQWKFWDDDGSAHMTLDFQDGQLSRFDGRPVDKLLPSIPQGTERADRLAGQLYSSTVFTFRETPLRDIIAYQSELHDFPLQLQKGKGIEADMLISIDLRGIPLIAGLALMLDEHDLCCVYRHGMLWVTSRAEQARPDPTRISGLEPPSNTPLARALEQDAVVQSVKAPLDQILKQLQQEHGIQLHCESVDTSVVPTISVRGLTLRNSLGVLLDQLDLQAEVGGPNELILRPQQ